MKLFLLIFLLLLGGFFYLRYRLMNFEALLPPEKKTELERLRAQAEQESADDQNELQKLTVYRTLHASIQEGMTLEQMIDAFAEMCKLPVGDPDDLLFETGTYSFPGESQFYFSLVRQFQRPDADEYVQLHLDVMYAPSPQTALFLRTEWGSPEDPDFFGLVKNSQEFQTVRALPISKVNVYIDET